MIDMKAKDTIMKIRSAGGKAYFVGGYVRDMLLGTKSHDIDICTNFSPEEIMEIFPGSEFVGKNFGVVLVEGTEVATYRKDFYDSGKTVNVEFIGSLVEDLSRRDFTINAMAMNLEGEIIDPFGGKRDLKSNVIRFVGNPVERIREDPIRILRGLRFAGKLGFRFERKTEVAMYENWKLLKTRPVEVIKTEIMKILSEVDKPIQVFTALGILRDPEESFYDFIFLSLEKTIGVNGGHHHAETVYDHCIVACDAISKKYPLIRLAALLHDVGKPRTTTYDPIQDKIHFYGHEEVGSELAERDLIKLKFSNDEIEYVKNLIKHHMFYFEDVKSLWTYRRFMSRLADVGIPVRDILRLRMADRKANKLKIGRAKVTYSLKETLRKIRAVEKDDAALKIADLELNGNDLIEMGLKPGPIFTEILKHLLELVLEKPERNEKRKLKRAVRKFLRGV